jgi:hypothetical protein
MKTYFEHNESRRRPDVVQFDLIDLPTPDGADGVEVQELAEGDPAYEAALWSFGRARRVTP